MGTSLTGKKTKARRMTRRQARLITTLLTVNHPEISPDWLLHTMMGPRLLRSKFSFWMYVTSVRLAGGVGNRKLRSLPVIVALKTKLVKTSKKIFLYILCRSSTCHNRFWIDQLSYKTPPLKEFLI